MENYLTDTKVSILLNTLDFQLKEIQRRQDREQQIFQWSTSLLLGILGVIIALSDRALSLQFLAMIKLLATIMVVMPIGFSILWILRLSRQAVGNAEVVERVEGLLHLFKNDYYGIQSPYPETWEGKLKHNLKQRRTPLYYSIVLVIMTSCVVIAIWVAM